MSLKTSVIISLIIILAGCASQHEIKPLHTINPEFKKGYLITSIKTHEAAPGPSLSKGEEKAAREALTNKYAEIDMQASLESLRASEPSMVMPRLNPVPVSYTKTEEYTNQVVALEEEILKRAEKSEEDTKIVIQKNGTINLINKNAIEEEKREINIGGFLALYYGIIAAILILIYFVWEYINKIYKKKNPAR